MYCRCYDKVKFVVDMYCIMKYITTHERPRTQDAALVRHRTAVLFFHLMLQVKICHPWMI